MTHEELSAQAQKRPAPAIVRASSTFFDQWLTHAELPIAAMMRTTMIIGIVTKVTMFYYCGQQELAPLPGKLLAEVSASIACGRLR